MITGDRGSAELFGGRVETFGRTPLPQSPPTGDAAGRPCPRGTTMSIRLLMVLLAALLSLQPALAAPTLQFEPHAFETVDHGTHDAEVGWLEVPVRHHQPDGPTMRLRVVRLRAHDRQSTRAPVVYLAGGPGGSGVGTARGSRWPVFDLVRRHSDVLLFDQRGTGLSGRTEDCEHRHAFEAGQSSDPGHYLAELKSTAARCVADWRSQGVAVDAFNTLESAQDIKALRRALGVERLSLWGMSYGTHLAMAVLREDREHVESLVLMGVEGPDDTLKQPLDADQLLQRLAEMIRNDPDAAALPQDLVGAIGRLLVRLDESPAEGRVRLTGSGVVTISRFDAQLAIAAALGRSDTLRLLPLAVAEAERGNYDLLAEFVHAVREALGTFNAMPLATDIASGASAERLTRIADGERHSLLGQALNFPFPAIAADLGIATLPDGFRAPLHSDVRTLMVSGSLDGRTPPSNATAAAAGFSDVRELLVVNAGHDDDLWLSHPAIADRIARFFAGEALADARLTAPPVRFATSVRGELWRILTRHPDGSLRGTTLIAGLFVVLAMAAGALGWRAWRRRRSSRMARTEPEPEQSAC